MEFLKQRFAPQLWATLKGEKEKKEQGKPVEQEKSFADGYGSREELAKAYSQLKQDYIEREQRWKEYEERERITKDRNLWRDKVDALTREYPFAVSYVAEMGEYFRLNPEKLGKEGCLEEALLHVVGKNLPKGKEGNAVPTENAELNTTESTPTEPEEVVEPKATASSDTERTELPGEGAEVGKQEDSVSGEAILPESKPLETKPQPEAISERKESTERFAPLMGKGGEIPLTAPLKPRSIREAGVMALRLMESK